MIKLHNKDCMVAMAGFSDNQFDLAIVDPPYGIGMAGGKWGNSKTNFKNFAGNDESIPQPEYYEQLIRVSKNYIVWGGNYMTEYLPPKPCFIVWDKVQPQEFTMAMAELAITSFDNPAKIFKQRIVGANKNGKIHPTQKPVKLYEWLIKFLRYKRNSYLVDKQTINEFYLLALIDFQHGVSMQEMKETLRMYEDIEDYEACQGIQKAIKEYENTRN